MKKGKVLFIIALALCLFAFNVNAEGPDPSNSRLEVDGKVLYEKGAKTNETVAGVTLDVENMTLTINSEFTAPNGDGIKVYYMGNNFVIVFDGDVKAAFVERNDAMFISNSTVILRSVNDGKFTATLTEGSGIIVDGTASLQIEDVKLEIGSIRFNDGLVTVWNTADLGSTKIYKNNAEIDLVEITTPALILDSQQTEEPTTTVDVDKSNIVKEDSFSKIAIYAIIAGLFVVAGVTVLLMSTKNQKK